MDHDLIKVRLKSITFEAEQINSYGLESESGRELPMFTAGSHIDLHLANGLIRSYSLLNDYNERSQYVIGVKHDPQGRGGSSFVHQRLKVGEVVTISSPRNNFAFHESTDSSVFIAGGIGITPILSMVRRAAALGRRWDLHYASRTRRHAAFLDQLETLERRSHGRLNAVFDHEDGGEPLNIASLVADVPPQSHIYCCGPLPLLEAFEAATQSRPRHMVHVEYFTAKEAAATAGGFEVRLARSGRSVPVCAGQTILDALLDAGVPISYSCSEGVCGTCETRVLEGIPDHRDVYLSDAEKAENKQIMICCSGSKTPTLLLDL